MRTHRKHIYWLCLLAYVWSATGLGSIVAVTAVTNEHVPGQVVVIPGQNDEVIFHHVGHRDKHELTANDATGRVASDVHHSQSDHVLKLDPEAEGNSSFPMALKFTNLLFAKLLGVAPHVMSRATLAVLDFTPAHTAIRNSNVAIVKMTRLRI